jgi:hypothetical protein
MIFCDALTLNTPPTIPTQTQYRVVVKVVGQQAIDATGAPVGLVVIGNLAVNSSGSELPADFVPVEASLEHEIVLLGYTANYSAADTGIVSDLNLFWKIQTELPESYHVFVHWIDAEGQMIAQSDGIPRNGLYPTDAWAIGEVIPDSYRLVSSGAVDLKQSRFLVGMYEYPSGQRLLTFGPLALDNAFSFPALETPR